MQRLTLTLCFVRESERLLLGMKKRGFGVGRWNGFGGKVHPGETIEEAAVREMYEETSITVHALKKVGDLEFHFPNEDRVLDTKIFVIESYSGIPEETEEMCPSWFGFDEIPYDTMWPDDQLWLPYLIEGRKFEGSFVFEDVNTLVSHVVRIVE